AARLASLARDFWGDMAATFDRVKKLGVKLPGVVVDTYFGKPALFISAPGKETAGYDSLRPDLPKRDSRLRTRACSSPIRRSGARQEFWPDGPPLQPFCLFLHPHPQRETHGRLAPDAF